jgi:CBS-domain-containing membrane protein
MRAGSHKLQPQGVADMPTMLKPLFNLTAADLMSQTLVAVPREMTLRGAARLLSRAHVSGAPVIDHKGQCVGVLTSTDFMHFVEKNPHDSASDHDRQAPEIHSASQLLDPDKLPTDQVSVYMTADPVTAGPATRIADLAGKMIDAHIHRLVVVDEQCRPIGIVSSTDILAAVARHRPGDTTSAGSDPSLQNKEVLSCTRR